MALLVIFDNPEDGNSGRKQEAWARAIGKTTERTQNADATRY